MLRPTTTNYNPMNISEFVKTSFGEEKNYGFWNVWFENSKLFQSGTTHYQQIIIP